MEYLKTPTEEEEQIMLFNWARLKEHEHPCLRSMFHIPNGGKRKKSEAARFKAAGVKAGVPDIFLPHPQGRWHGLFIELKRREHGRVSTNQTEFLSDLAREGFSVFVCYGWEQAAETIVEYLEGKI